MVAECAVDFRPGARGKVSFWAARNREKRMERRAAYAL
jgi:hypothetical protein